MIKDKIYEIVRSIPKGKVTTYKEIAISCGNAKLARVVGNEIHKNVDLDNIPCYKVVTSKGKLSSNYAFGGIEGQKKLLERDGIMVSEKYLVDLEKYLYFVEGVYE